MTVENTGGSPTVSVVIAAYNAEGFLPRAVQSALQQEELSVEIVIVDDASTDSTLAIANELSREDARVRVVPMQRNGGPAAARNAGIGHARGEWIAVLDADDEFARGHLAGLRRVAAELDADIVLGNFTYVDPTAQRENGTGLRTDAPARRVDLVAYLEHCQGRRGQADWGLLKPIFRGRFLADRELAYPTHSRHGEDFLLIVEALLNGAKVAVSHVASYRYTHRSVGWSRTRIDYSGQVDQARTLMLDARIVGNAAACAALAARMRALEQIGASHEINRAGAEGARFGLLARAVVNPPLRAELGRRLGRKLDRLLRPDRVGKSGG